MNSLDLQVIYDSLVLQHLSFEERIAALILTVVVIFILFLITGRYWKQIFKHLTRHPEASDIFHGHVSIKNALHDIAFILKILLIIYVLITLRSTLHQRPYVVQSYPPENSRFVTAAPKITIDFTLPVDRDNIQFHLSPEIDGTWEWEGKIFGLPLYDRVTFYPKESFLPNSQIVVYLVGLKPPWYSEKSHELALEYSAPRVPKIIDTSPQKNAVDVPVNEPLTIEYDSPIGTFVDTKLEITPEAKIAKIDQVENKQIVYFEKNLRQDQKYTVKVYQTERSYNVLTNDDLERGETKLLKTFQFTTVTTPLIDTYEPKGDSVKADASVHVAFDQEMNRASVETSFSIEPNVPGSIEWDDDKNLRYIFSEPLQKETTYNIVFKSGFESLSGGITDEDITLTFTTIGKVAVESSHPISSSTGIDITNPNITIVFNQPVDKDSAQSHFSISPAVAGTFIWTGESSFEFKPTASLAYSTRYTITIQSGVKSIYGLDSEQQSSFNFVTKSNTFSLSVPYYKQQEGFTCNIAATRMVLAYRGVSLSEDAIRSGIGYNSDPNIGWVSGYGVHAGPVSTFVSRYRQSSVKSGWNVPDMLKEVQNGNPVIIWEYNRYSQPYGSFILSSGATGYTGMHSEVVRGWIGDINNPTHILTNDPWRGYLTYDIQTFNSVWSYLNNTALVVY